MARKLPLLDVTGQDIADGIHDIATALGGSETLSFKRIQRYIRAGVIDKYLAIGDEVSVEKETGVSVSSSNQNLTVSIVESTWNEAIETMHSGTFAFSYDGYGWTNSELGGEYLDLSHYGITVSGTPSSGDVISVVVTTDTLTFVYVAKNKQTMRNSALANSCTFQLKNIYRTLQFAQAQALIYVSTALTAGTTYQIYLHKPSNIYYLNAGLQNKYLNFTPSVAVPVGGQLVISTGDMRNSTSVGDLKLTSYSTKGGTTVLESGITCSEGSEGDGGTSLGYANYASNNTIVNSTDRTLYGSNNWEYSALRQWLNSKDEAGVWWSPKGNFDRSPSQASASGWMRGISKDFLDVLQEVETPTTQNWFDGGTTKKTYDKFFVPSLSQVYMSSSETEGENWDYYVDFSDLSSAGTGADSNRIKTLNGNATYWWLRTPYGSNSTLEYIVSPAGASSYYYAYNSYGVAPACVIA